MRWASRCMLLMILILAQSFDLPANAMMLCNGAASESCPNDSIVSLSEQIREKALRSLPSADRNHLLDANEWIYLRSQMSFIASVASDAQKMGFDFRDIVSGEGSDSPMINEYFNSCFSENIESNTAIPDFVKHDVKSIKSSVNTIHQDSQGSSTLNSNEIRKLEIAVVEKDRLLKLQKILIRGIDSNTGDNSIVQELRAVNAAIKKIGQAYPATSFLTPTALESVRDGNLNSTESDTLNVAQEIRDSFMEAQGRQSFANSLAFTDPKVPEILFGSSAPKNYPTQAISGWSKSQFRSGSQTDAPSNRLVGWLQQDSSTSNHELILAEYKKYIRRRLEKSVEFCKVSSNRSDPCTALAYNMSVTSDMVSTLVNEEERSTMKDLICQCPEVYDKDTKLPDDMLRFAALASFHPYAAPVTSANNITESLRTSERYARAQETLKRLELLSQTNPSASVNRALGIQSEIVSKLQRVVAQQHSVGVEALQAVLRTASRAGRVAELFSSFFKGSKKLPGEIEYQPVSATEKSRMRKLATDLDQIDAEIANIDRKKRMASPSELPKLEEQKARAREIKGNLMKSLVSEGPDVADRAVLGANLEAAAETNMITFKSLPRGRLTTVHAYRGARAKPMSEKNKTTIGGPTEGYTEITQDELKTPNNLFVSNGQATIRRPDGTFFNRPARQVREEWQNGTFNETTGKPIFIENQVSDDDFNFIISADPRKTPIINVDAPASQGRMTNHATEFMDAYNKRITEVDLFGTNQPVVRMVHGDKMAIRGVPGYSVDDQRFSYPGHLIMPGKAPIFIPDRETYRQVQTIMRGRGINLPDDLD